MFYICIDHLSDQELQILGYTVIGEDEEFKIYRCYDGDVHIVDKRAESRFMYVNDVNDAIAMRSAAIIPLPRRPNDP